MSWGIAKFPWLKGDLTMIECGCIDKNCGNNGLYEAYETWTDGPFFERPTMYLHDHTGEGSVWGFWISRRVTR